MYRLQIELMLRNLQQLAELIYYTRDVCHFLTRVGDDISNIGHQVVCDVETDFGTLRACLFTFLLSPL